MTQLTKLKIKFAIWLFIAAAAMFIFLCPRYIPPLFVISYLLLTSLFFSWHAIEKTLYYTEEIVAEEKRIFSLKYQSNLIEPAPFESLEKNQGKCPVPNDLDLVG